MAVTLDFSRIRFDDRGLVPVIVQDAVSKEVLTLAYMNEEALRKTLETGETWFWSRSRQKLWHKGETSGNTQRVLSLAFDCDRDALLVRVIPSGPACHKGTTSCFEPPQPLSGEAEAGREGAGINEPESSGDSHFPRLESGHPSAISQGTGSEGTAVSSQGTHNDPTAPSRPPEADSRTDPSDRFAILNRLEALIAAREAERPEGSYTAYLFEKGLDKILKKVGEEAAEVIIAAKNRSREELRYEAADLVFHLLVLLREAKLPLDEVLAELSRRHRGE